MPLISIIIPLYNKDFIIKKTLQSVLEQTYKNYEVIIINDGSTDNSVNIASQFKDRRIVIHNQTNKGAASARNLGIEKSKGELIAFLDADDYWFPNHLEEIVKLYLNYPDCGIYASRYFIKFSESKIIKVNYKNNILNSFRGILADYFKASMKFRIGLTSAIAVPRKILIENNLLFNSDVSSGQDLELYTKIAIKFLVAITNKYTVEYNFSINNQLSKTPIIKKRLLDFNQFKEIEKRNHSLKKYLDLYRLEYAFHYKIYGNHETSNLYLNDIKKENIPFKAKILLKTPSILLYILHKLKQKLRKIGFYFSIYN